MYGSAVDGCSEQLNRAQGNSLTCVSFDELKLQAAEQFVCEDATVEYSFLSSEYSFLSQSLQGSGVLSR